jgi:hypothetical protein
MAAVGIEAVARWDVYQLVGLEQTAAWNVAAPAPYPPVGLDPELDDRCSAFARVHTDFLVEGNSRVTWTLRDRFAGPAPYTFQLQVGESANPLADDWRDVGAAVVNTFTATDPERRALGKQLTVHYRVRLTDAADNVYYSAPATVLGDLNQRDWLNAREMLRQQRLRLRQFAGVRGFLLKRKRSGTPCPRCVDVEANMVTDSRCPVCRGTRFLAGYFRAMPAQYADPETGAVVEKHTAGPEGWSAPIQAQALFLGTPFLTTGDLWVDAVSDLRYHIDSVKAKARVRGVPLLLEVTMMPLPLQDVAYSIPLEGTGD